MSSLITAFIIIGITGSLAVVVFSEQIKVVVLDVLIEAVSENAARSAPPVEPLEIKPQTTSTPNPKWVPPGFKGPTGEPRIIGPGSNPPNY